MVFTFFQVRTNVDVKPTQDLGLWTQFRHDILRQECEGKILPILVPGCPLCTTHHRCKKKSLIKWHHHLCRLQIQHDFGNVPPQGRLRWSPLRHPQVCSFVLIVYARTKLCNHPFLAGFVCFPLKYEVVVLACPHPLPMTNGMGLGKVILAECYPLEQPYIAPYPKSILPSILQFGCWIGRWIFTEGYTLR